MKDFDQIKFFIKTDDNYKIWILDELKREKKLNSVEKEIITIEDKDCPVNFDVTFNKEFGWISKDILNSPDAANWTALDFDTIQKISKKKNIERIYYKTVFDEATHMTYINLKSPITLIGAIHLFEKYYVPNPKNNNHFSKKSIDPYQIYTFKEEDAQELLLQANNIPWSGYDLDPNPKYNFCAENHAFIEVYKKYSDHYCIPFKDYVLNHLPHKNRPLYPGYYFWHYHCAFRKHHHPFFEESPDNSNTKHVFFGVPIMITLKDINRFGDGSRFDLKDLEMYRNNDLFLQKNLYDIIKKNNKVFEKNRIEKGMNPNETVSIAS